MQLTEKMYRSLAHSTWKLRFTFPFPLLAFPAYLVRGMDERDAQTGELAHKLIRLTELLSLIRSELLQFSP